MNELPSLVLPYLAPEGPPLANGQTLSPQEPLLLAVNGLRLLARPIDWYGIQDVLLKGDYHFVFETLDRSRPLRALDLGANIGAFSLALLAQAPEAEVVSVEPASDTFKLLLANRQLHAHAGWTALRAAAGGASGSAVLSRHSLSTGTRLSNYALDPAHCVGAEQVDLLSMEDLLSRLSGRAAELVKMDIEGAEVDVLTKDAAWLSRVERLLVEVHADRIKPEGIYTALFGAYPCVYRVLGTSAQKPLLFCTHQPIASSKLQAFQG